ncbi:MULTISPECIES: bifunctional adenosylcobinamide kinase/adenosylcobinamide-phosphate guanylyltransferase [Clostridium]|jgi:adenosylcobinamide kinase/adenosylcobinamide-phosphate guanylyltransferase|uniref:Adenosylcobinamide kinase n=2 Tax=Clostridium butyricum TaxID=1492 RepID=C4IN31_CLOBU|nr:MULTISPECIES: bifunctional adenosylcobinamide kinase/adenosylcobinamide-phosphate guanylyltransferase [Clostridium]ETI91908.1 MAG: Cobinamide kinase [Clostridium butyricum DORA_1]ALP88798.1 cobalamin biosynthesis protein [Clostridium butyricum]ALS18402.1 cobalamin biosynthesis protein [Clostridium butyricum]ANF15528.1 cobalamin biosynthesis protein [Clostridium butyricum]AOR95476.1 cobalamin biosynthesis protein [Clostridium butyricum]
MLTLITGGSGSGKSEFAEDLSVSYKSNNLIYIATMFLYDNESLKKVERHKRMRDHKNFKTIECFKNLKSLFISNNSTVLIDCMSNLVANEMYLEGGAKDKTVQEVIRGIESINNQAENLVIVTNEVFSDGIVYDDDTMRYIRNLGEINKEIGKKADNVVEVVYSIPIFHKGGI